MLNPYSSLWIFQLPSVTSFSLAQIINKLNGEGIKLFVCVWKINYNVNLKMRKLLELFWFYWFSIDQNITPTYWPHSPVVTTSLWSETRRSWSDDGHGDNESDSERWSVRDNSLFTHQHLTKWPIMITWFDYNRRKMLKPMPIHTHIVFLEAQICINSNYMYVMEVDNVFFRFSVQRILF